jgi:hypothetical protein
MDANPNLLSAQPSLSQRLDTFCDALAEILKALEQQQAGMKTLEDRMAKLEAQSRQQIGSVQKTPAMGNAPPPPLSSQNPSAFNETSLPHPSEQKNVTNVPPPTLTLATPMSHQLAATKLSEIPTLEWERHILSLTGHYSEEQLLRITELRRYHAAMARSLAQLISHHAICAPPPNGT